MYILITIVLSIYNTQYLANQIIQSPCEEKSKKELFS